MCPSKIQQQGQVLTAQELSLNATAAIFLVLGAGAGYPTLFNWQRFRSRITPKY
jgi:hypothetical protein